MQVVGKSKAHIVLDSCFHESGIYFADHEKLIMCNPYCSNVKYLKDLDIFQWIFQVADPRSNPIIAVFFVRQHEENFLLDDSYGKAFAEARVKNRAPYNGKGKRIRWEAVHDHPEFEKSSPHNLSLIHI